MNPYHAVPHIQLSLFRECPKTGYKIDTRTISDNELVLITGGSGKIIIENSVYELKQGTLLYFYPGIKHAIYSFNDNPMSFYGIHFSYLNVKYVNKRWINEEDNEALPIKIISEAFAFPKLESLFKKLNTYWNEKSLGFEIICRGCFLKYYIISCKIQMKIMPHAEKLKCCLPISTKISIKRLP